MKILITGGCGFVGCNIAKFYLERGDEVVALDDLSRSGAEKNLAWLEKEGKIEFIKQDIADYNGFKHSINSHRDIDVIYHMAAQVAVTTSVLNPRRDFEINAFGTLNLLEAVREFKINPAIIYASTNKIYGEMLDLKIIEKNNRYQYAILKEGIAETRQLDFHSPYGCSKGCADQYMIDYARIYGLNTVIMRQSCIYGPRQFGVEDQGWVAHFIICAVLNRPITIYGDGKQARDVLYIDDLVNLFHLAYRNIKKIKGAVFNVGGGIKNQMSLLKLVSILEDKLKKKIKINYADWRPGDQKVYVSDIQKAQKLLNWKPKISKKDGIFMLIDWVQKNKELFR